MSRVERSVSEHLSIHGQAESQRGGWGALCCLCCPNEISTPPFDTSDDALKIVENGLEMRKFLQLTQSRDNIFKIVKNGLKMRKLQPIQSRNDALKIVKNGLKMRKLQPIQSRDDALKIVKNGLEMRKLQPTQSL